MSHPDVAAIIADLRARGVDVVRLSYSDMIGVDRGRDVLLGELESVLHHGAAFCRAIYHTTPRGDVVPVQGGLEAGLPDVKLRFKYFICLDFWQEKWRNKKLERY